ncbi:MAG: hypothetical protein AAC990_04795 [Dehalococcoides mccartyi]|uniref:hypothetical protein n=1 Tax=Dehalococcoides mccartyi TaxID=61435 RepID=UPI0030F5C3AC
MLFIQWLIIAIALVALINYRWFWSHTQFWVPPEKRRPYTFIIRDIIYNWSRKSILTFSLSMMYAGVLLAQVITDFGMMISICTGVILGHLFFGKDWIPGEMDTPTKKITADEARAYVGVLIVGVTLITMACIGIYGLINHRDEYVTLAAGSLGGSLVTIVSFYFNSPKELKAKVKAWLKNYRD